MRLQSHAVQVLILDWDVHHGNGTEDIFYESNDVLYISAHQQGLWPYTGVWRAQQSSNQVCACSQTAMLVPLL
jgi:acetoin utilization deacetylase AcuC-like enzyme